MSCDNCSTPIDGGCKVNDKDTTGDIVALARFRGRTSCEVRETCTHKVAVNLRPFCYRVFIHHDEITQTGVTTTKCLSRFTKLKATRICHMRDKLQVEFVEL